MCQSESLAWFAFIDLPILDLWQIPWCWGRWGRLEEIQLLKNFPNSADPVELPQACLQFITMKGKKLRSICSLHVFFFLKIIFLSFLLYLTTRLAARVLGQIQIQESRKPHLHCVLLKPLICQEVLPSHFFRSAAFDPSFISIWTVGFTHINLYPPLMDSAK